MKGYSYFMAVLATIVFLVGGIFCFSFSKWRIPSPDAIAPFLLDHILWVVFIGLGLTFLSLIELYLAVKNLRRIPAIAFINPLGEVRITYAALEDYIKSLKDEVPEIKEVKPQVVAGRRGVEIYSRVIVERDVNLPEITSKFQDMVSRYVKDVLGIEDIASIKVYIQKISPRVKYAETEEA